MTSRSKPQAAVRRGLPAAAALLTMAFLFAGCGEESTTTAENPKPSRLAIEAAEAGKRSTLEAPGAAKPGLVELELTNTGQQQHAAQLLRVEGDHQLAEVLAAYEGAAMGKPVPEWLFGAGGVGLTEPGAAVSVVQRLEPGTYWVVDDAGEGRPNYEAGGVARLVVEGEPAAASTAPKPAATVTASEYAFEAKRLSAGRGEIRFVNAGAEPHHLLAAPILPGKTLEDVADSLEKGGPPPVEIDEETTSAVLEGGEEQVLEVDLEPGRYALFCFITDRAGGPPHAFKGMVGEAVVR